MKTIFFVLMAVMASCGGQSNAEKAAASTLLLGTVAFGKRQYTNDQITGINISHTHMTLYSMKSFELREANGETLFSCHFYSDTTEVKVEKMCVSPEYMQRLREIAKKYDFASLKEKKKNIRPFVHDAPMYGMTLYWRDKQSLRLNYWPVNGGEELENFFREIAHNITTNL